MRRGGISRADLLTALALNPDNPTRAGMLVGYEPVAEVAAPSEEPEPVIGVELLQDSRNPEFAQPVVQVP